MEPGKEELTASDGSSHRESVGRGTGKLKQRQETGMLTGHQQNDFRPPFAPAAHSLQRMLSASSSRNVPVVVRL